MQQLYQLLNLHDKLSNLQSTDVIQLVLALGSLTLSLYLYIRLWYLPEKRYKERRGMELENLKRNVEEIFLKYFPYSEE